MSENFWHENQRQLNGETDSLHSDLDTMDAFTLYVENIIQCLNVRVFY